MSKQRSEELQQLEYRLEAWARWKRTSGQLPVDGWSSATLLGRMIEQDLAALIHGVGFKPEPDYEDEENIDKAIRSLPDDLGKVIYINYMSMLPQKYKAKKLNITYRTFIDHLSLAKHRVMGYLTGLKKSA